MHAQTVNGDVSVRAHGSAEAQTVNGSIEAMIGHADRADDLRFETVNGNITLLLPEDAGAEIEAHTLNGDIDTDWPLEIERGGWVGRSAKGVIGGGGPELSLKTINGSIHLGRDSESDGWVMEEFDRSEQTRWEWEADMHEADATADVEVYADASEPVIVMEDENGYGYVTGDEQARRRSVEQLARNAPPQAAAEALERIAFGDPSERVQREATEALADLPDECGIDALVRIASEHPRRRIRARARRALEEHEHIRTLIVHHDAEAPRELARAEVLDAETESTDEDDSSIRIDLDLDNAEMNQLIGRSVAAGLHAAEVALEAADFGRAIAELTGAATIEALSATAESVDDPAIRRELERARAEVREELARELAKHRR